MARMRARIRAGRASALDARSGFAMASSCCGLGRLPEGLAASPSEQRNRFPAIAGDDGAIGTEPVAERREVFRAWRWVEAPGEAVALAYAEVVDGPDVEPAELEHEVHLCGPSSDAAHGYQIGDDLV